jgi:hypothetical protein
MTSESLREFYVFLPGRLKQSLQRDDQFDQTIDADSPFLN